MFTSAQLAATPSQCHVHRMVWQDARWRPRQKESGEPRGPLLDMTPDGQFVEAQPRPSMSPFNVKVTGVAAVVVVLAGAIGFALLALWLVLQLIPIAIGAGLIAYGVYRFQAWRARQSLFSRERYPLRR